MSDKSCPFATAARLYRRLVDWINLLQPVLLLGVRIYIGYQAMVAGWAHLHHVDQTADYFKSLDIPMPRLNVYIAGLTEFIGGGLLLIGLLSRLTAIPFTFNFLIAIVSVHLQDAHNSLGELFGKIWDNQDIVLKDDAFPFMFAGLMILIFGPGLFSADGLLKSMFCRKKEQVNQPNAAVIYAVPQRLLPTNDAERPPEK
ncbi:MAG TPA: DoxX family protein [Tepidisphaeraceae bacterium]|nr:DoxX family protein [Tepidisphaeraceae bacterium]